MEDGVEVELVVTWWKRKSASWVPLFPLYFSVEASALQPQSQTLAQGLHLPFEECLSRNSPPPPANMSLSSLRSIFKTKKSKRHGKSKPSTAAATDLLALEIYSAHILLYSNPPSTISDNANAVEAMTTGDGSPATNSTCLLSGALSEFLRYSRQERSQWLIDIAHDICDLRFRRGSLVVWKDQQWLPVANTDPLTASEYRYDLPTMVTIGLSKISLRTGKSRTSASGNASTMASRVMQRDGVCWVSDLEDPILNSHICPKRLGDHTAQIIFETFTSTTPPPNLSIYNEIFGLNLSNNLGGLFDNHCLGFHHVAPVRNSHLVISKIFIDQLFRMFMSPMCSSFQIPMVSAWMITPYMDDQDNPTPTFLPFMGILHTLPSPSTTEILHQGYFAGITFSVLSRSLGIMITKPFKISISWNCLFKWKVILMMIALTVRLSGRQWLLI
jgi:hypothetical protein